MPTTCTHAHTRGDSLGIVEIGMARCRAVIHLDPVPRRTPQRIYIRALQLPKEVSSHNLQPDAVATRLAQTIQGLPGPGPGYALGPVASMPSALPTSHSHSYSYSHARSKTRRPEKRRWTRRGGSRQTRDNNSQPRISVYAPPALRFRPLLLSRIERCPC